MSSFVLPSLPLTLSLSFSFSLSVEVKSPGNRDIPEANFLDLNPILRPQSRKSTLRRRNVGGFSAKRANNLDCLRYVCTRGARIALEVTWLINIDPLTRSVLLLVSL